MDEILVWPARDSGAVSHFWLEQDGYQRVCDGTPWPGGIYRPDRRGIAVPCRPCNEVYLEDVLRGRQVMTIAASDFTPDPLDFRVATLENGVNTRKLGSSTPEKRVDMPRISMTQFSRFCEARTAEQVRIVREIRRQQADPCPADFLRRNFYGLMIQHLRSGHWLSGDIQALENSLPHFIGSLSDSRKVRPYGELGEGYVEYWNQRQGDYFAPPGEEVQIGGLTIRVRPEVGIREGRDRQVLKVWLNTDPPSRQVRQVMLYLMEEARSLSTTWRMSWDVGIWDVRRRTVPQSIRTAQDFGIGLMGHAGAFLQIWQALDDEAAQSEI